ncbi:MAG: LPS export ABC transporter periplasmic protein LptC [Myxococcota bacterium]
MRTVRFNRGCAAVAARVAVLLATAGGVQAAPGLKVTGMTFVGSRGGLSELVVRAEQAHFFPDTSRANLVRVRASVSDGEKGDSFKMTCDEAELNIETNDFTAIGNVEGVTGEGQQYSAPWVSYEHLRSMLHTDAPVVVQDQHGRYRGDGFRYFIEERRFELLGNVSVEQNQ